MFEGNDLGDIEDLKEIRAEQDYFKRLCFFHQLNIMRIVTEKVTVGKGLDKYELFAIQCAMRNFESDLIGLWNGNEEYLKKREELLEGMNESSIGNKSIRKDYFESLMEWKDELVKVLCKETEYLPLKKVGLHMTTGKIVNKGESYYEQNAPESANGEDLQSSQ